MPPTPIAAEPALTPVQCRMWRESSGLSHDQLARRIGLDTGALERFEAGGGGLAPTQIDALARALRPIQAPSSRARMLDFGPVGTAIFLLGAAIPLIWMVMTGLQALRFITADQAVAEVVGFERRTRIAEPDSGPRYTYETVAPLLRFHQTDGGGEVTIAWRDTLPHEAEFALGDRLWVTYPRGAPEALTLSLVEVMLTPLLCAVIAAPLLGIGLVSLRRLLQRKQGA